MSYWFKQWFFRKLNVVIALERRSDTFGLAFEYHSGMKLLYINLFFIILSISKLDKDL